MDISKHSDLLYFLNACTASILDKPCDPIIQSGAKAFNAAIDASSPKTFTVNDLPVVLHLNSIYDSPFTFNFQQIATSLQWIPSPRTDYCGKSIALCSFNEMLALKNIVAGLVFMRPNQVYPQHSHSPQELYFILSGNAKWLFGGNTQYKNKTSGDLIYNHPNDIHGIKTENEPLLALYVLWGKSTEKYRI